MVILGYPHVRLVHGRRLGLNQIDEIGVNKVMWSSDYPHNESTCGYSERSLAAVVDAVGPDDAVCVLGGNIRRFLGLCR
jgi:predicted TIM-barrel fold metal-dependent hydrolase